MFVFNTTSLSLHTAHLHARRRIASPNGCIELRAHHPHVYCSLGFHWRLVFALCITASRHQLAHELAARPR